MTTHSDCEIEYLTGCVHQSATCAESSCGWNFHAGTRTAVKTMAEEHVERSGHEVIVSYEARQRVRQVPRV